jgi:predicted metalloprotease
VGCRCDPVVRSWAIASPWENVMSGTFNRTARITAVLALLLAAVLGALVDATAVRAQDSVDSGVSGDSYTSPEFGYSFSWDRSWEVKDEVIEDGYNLLRLDDEGSLLYFEGYADVLAVEECHATYGIEVLGSSEAISDLESTEPTESSDGALSSDVTFVVTFEDEETGEDVVTDWSGYVSCQEINDGEANLVISHLGPAETWEDEEDARQDVLDTLTYIGEAPVEPGDEDESDVGAPDESADRDDAPAEPMSAPAGDGELPPNADDLLNLFSTSINDINNYWAREFPLVSAGQEYVAPEHVIPWVGQIETPCGTATGFDEAAGTGDGPFYCPPNKTIYLDMGFANLQMDVVGQVPFVVPVVLAHEMGHHVQELLGMQSCEVTPCLDPNELTSQEIEYMADCFAGSWSRDAELRGRLGERDIDANIVQYAVILGGGQEGADPGGHGRGAERVWWFLNGYLEGSGKCFETSAVTADWLQTGPPNGQADVTPEPTEEATEEPVDEPTEEGTEGEPTEAAEGQFANMGEAVESSEGAFTVTRTQVETEIEGRTADGQFVIVYAEVIRPEGEDTPFNYENWVLADAQGTVYELDSRTTDVLLSSAYEDGTDEVLVAGEGYNIALVFDVPADASGFALINESETIGIFLDI